MMLFVFMTITTKFKIYKYLFFYMKYISVWFLRDNKLEWVLNFMLIGK